MITMTPGLRIQSEKALNAYLEADLRFDTSALKNMNAEIVRECRETGRKKDILERLLKILQS